MLNKEQLREIKGGYGACDYFPHGYATIWYCCDISQYFISVVGWYDCDGAMALCSPGVVTNDPYNGCPW